MSSERPTVRPVTLARLAEVAHFCDDESRSTAEIETELEITHRRARETILEAQRINLLSEFDPDSDTSVYRTIDIGLRFIQKIRNEEWSAVSDLLRTNSPHYRIFLGTLDEQDPAPLDGILSRLEELDEERYSFNETSVEVLGDWAERLSALQRNAFTGSYYPVKHTEVPPDFGSSLLSAFDRLEQTAGVNLSQRYLSIPELRENVCERLNCTRGAFDEGILSLVSQNVGKLELSGAPIDTGAKDAKLGIKQIELADSGGLVSTDQSTDLVMSGVEQFGKQYYYLAVHDDDITHSPEVDT
jgi:hypothetical protein